MKIKIKTKARSACRWNGSEWQFDVLPSICVTKVSGEMEICFNWLFWYVFFRTRNIDKK